MRPRTLLILFVVVLALAAFIRFYEHDLPSSEERAARAKHVLDLKADQVTRLRIDSDGTTVVLERRRAAKPAPAAAAMPGLPPGVPASPDAAAEWAIVRPLAARADAGAVGALLDSLANLDKTRTLDKVVPADVGLDKPRAVVTLSVEGQTAPTVLRVGAAVPTGGEMIVGVAGKSDAYAVGDGLLADLRKKPGDWRDKQLFHGDRDAVERLSWTVGGGPRVVLAKRGDRYWLESPIADRADRDQVEKLLTDLTSLAADRFVDAPATAAGAANAAPAAGAANSAPGAPAATAAAATPAASGAATAANLPPPGRAAMGLEPPRLVVEAVLAGQPTPFRVELGESHTVNAPPAEPGAPETAASATYGRVGGTLFETRSPLAQTLARPVADWRSMQLSGLEVHQVDSAVVRQGAAAPVQLTRSGTDWQRGPTKISYLPVSDLLFAVTEAKADRLLSAAEAQALGAGQGQPLLTFELKAGQAGNETLTVYPALTGATHGLPARSSGRDTVLLLPEGKLQDIQDRLQALRVAPPLAPPKAGKPANPAR